jgi:Cof subfamily protein (haloacid dehalogenase superfamily)
VEDEQEAPGLGLPGRHLSVLSFKLFAVDLDGTLVDGGGAAHPSDREAIVALAAKGVPTTIITGRLFSGTRHVASDIGTTRAVACVDGSHLVEAATGKDLHHGGLAGHHAVRLREILGRHAAAAFVFAQDQILYDERGAPHLSYLRTWSVDHVQTERVTEHAHWDDPRGVTALVGVGEQSDVASLEQEIRDALTSAVYTISFPIRRFAGEATFGLVVRAAGYSKGTALVWLAAHYDVRPEDVVAVGDWWNDVPMFESAGRSFVMAQAPEDVKRTATDRLAADSSTGGGIAEAAKRCGLL